jgi:hypothetical protein
MLDYYFLTADDDPKRPGRQGKIVRQLGKERFEVVYFSWFHGGPTNHEVVTLATITEAWDLFPDFESFDHEAGVRQSRARREAEADA